MYLNTAKLRPALPRRIKCKKSVNSLARALKSPLMFIHLGEHM
jgi:hypothetical protein